MFQQFKGSSSKFANELDGLTGSLGVVGVQNQLYKLTPLM
jgi:hypothetical protein